MKLEMRRGCIADWLGADGVLEIDMDDSTREKVWSSRKSMCLSIDLCKSEQKVFNI